MIPEAPIYSIQGYRVMHWVSRQTHKMNSIMDLGAGQFNKLASLKAKTRIGVEVFEPYVKDFARNGVTCVCADMRDFDSILSDLGMESVDCVMSLDSLEHIPKEDGLSLLEKCKLKSSKILIFTPLGFCDQGDDSLGYDNPHQSHKSGWMPEELEDLGFKVRVEENFHNGNHAAIFAVWSAS